MSLSRRVYRVTAYECVNDDIDNSVRPVRPYIGSLFFASYSTHQNETKSKARIPPSHFLLLSLLSFVHGHTQATISMPISFKHPSRSNPAGPFPRPRRESSWRIHGPYPPSGTAAGVSASPRPGGGTPTGRLTSELLGSTTFQAPEGELASPLSFFFSIFALLTPIVFFSADAIDQWFENVHHYEVTLVSI